MSCNNYVLHFDGGAAPTNPGPAAAGAVLLNDEEIVARWGMYISWATNNVAEYNGLIIGLQNAIKLGIKNIKVKGDSQLAITQINGEFKVRNEGLIPLHTQVKQLQKQFDSISFLYIPRKLNQCADDVCNECLETKKNINIE